MSSYVDKAEVTREFYRRQGEQRERERIIELLEADETFPIFAYYIWNPTNAQFLINSLIALIKGENK